MHISQNVLGLFHLMTQEDGAQPGAPLSAIKAILYFVGAPIAIFLVITGLVLLVNAPKSKSSQISKID